MENQGWEKERLGLMGIQSYIETYIWSTDAFGNYIIEIAC